MWERGDEVPSGSISVGPRALCGVLGDPSLIFLRGGSRCRVDSFRPRLAAGCTSSCSPPSRCWRNKHFWGPTCAPLLESCSGWFCTLTGAPQAAVLFWFFFLFFFGLFVCLFLPSRVLSVGHNMFFVFSR